MKAIILAAGVGRRLYPLTKDVPKCMLQIGDRPLLTQIVGNLIEAGIKEILIVTGHGAQFVEDLANSLKGGRISCLYNPNYAGMNNCYSLWLALRKIPDGVLIYNSDLLCGKGLVRRIVEVSSKDSLLIDSGKALGGEEMKVQLNGEGRLSKISKGLSPAQASGEYIGLAKFSRRGRDKLLNYLNFLIKGGGVDQFYEAAFDLLAKSHPLYGVCFQGEPWVEIDNFEDLKRARDQIWPRLMKDNQP